MSNKVATFNEIFLLEVILKNTSKATIDWNEVASATDMSAGGARNKLGFITKEYLENHPDADKRSTAAAAKPQTPKRKAKEIANEDEATTDNAATATTSKGVPKTPKTKKAKVAKQSAKEEPKDDAGAEAADDED